MTTTTKALWIIAVIVTCALASCQVVRGQVITDRLLDAIAQIESSGRANAIGDGGKARGMFQLHRAAWEDARMAQPSLAVYESGSLNPVQARLAARTYLEILAARLQRATGNTPTAGQIYASFNLGFAGFKKRGFNLDNCPQVTIKAINKLERILHANR